MINNKLEVGDLVRYKANMPSSYNTWWGYISDNKSNGHHIYVHWFAGPLFLVEPSLRFELREDLKLMAKGKINE